jgi:hypothetical protein
MVVARAVPRRSGYLSLDWMNEVVEMSKQRSLNTMNTLVRFGAGLFCLGLIFSCGPSSEDKVAAENACSQYASSQSGYTPANPPGGDSSIGKGAAVGAVGGAAVGAATAKSGKSTKKAVQGAAVGAAAGAGLGALKDNEDKRKAEQGRAAYQSAFKACMIGKGY